MYDYIALRIESEPCDEDITDLLASFLADAGYESFVPDSSGLTAYIRKDQFNRDEVGSIISDFPIPCSLSYSYTEIEGQDWNKEWEQNYFKPINIDNRLMVRSSFHEPFPEAEIEIIIDPKMAFGTGHHATTAGMARLLMTSEIKGKTVIDMGTGTGILSILAKKLGAADTTGIDIDEFAIENARENGELNSENILWITGDDHALEHLQPADIFLANINLNVIKDNLHKYLTRLKPGGYIFLSGFLTDDKPEILDLAHRNGLMLCEEYSEAPWLALKFKY